MAEVKDTNVAPDALGGILDGVVESWLPFIDRALLKTALAKIGVTDPHIASKLMPPVELVFEWLRYFGPDDMMGCIVGQDPYPSGAIGLSFAKRAADGMPKSYEPIIRCLERSELIRPRSRRHADLRPQVAQGMLMMNMTLTTLTGVSAVREHVAAWKPVTTTFLTRACKWAQERKIEWPFLLWGNSAKDGVGGIARRFKHPVFEWSHPSPMADNQIASSKKFVNCTNFTDANAFLKSSGRRPIHWDNMHPVVAFVDGACSGNGKPDAVAGFSVVIIGGQFGRTTASGAMPRTTFAPLDKSRPELGFLSESATERAVTNNRAELLAICWAVLILIRGFAFGDVEIFSDSKTSVNTLNEWLPNRRRLGTAAALENMDLLEIIEALIVVLRSRTTKLTLSHVSASHDARLKKGATERETLMWRGNDVADRLAKQAKETQAPIEITSPMPVVRALEPTTPEL